MHVRIERGGGYKLPLLTASCNQPPFRCEVQLLQCTDMSGDVRMYMTKATVASILMQDWRYDTGRSS